MKIFRVVRDYEQWKVYEIVIAKDEEEVYELTGWTKDDKPELEIEEIEFTKGLKLSVPTKTFYPFGTEETFFDKFCRIVSKK